MIAFTPEMAAARNTTESPDRVDALVWALADLFSSMTIPQRSERDIEERSNRNAHQNEGRDAETGD